MRCCSFRCIEIFNFNRETQFGHLRHDVVEQGQESKGRSIALLPHVASLAPTLAVASRQTRGSIQCSYSKEQPGVVRAQERYSGDLNALKDQNNKGACLISHAVAHRTICKGLQTSLPNARQGLRRDDDAAMSAAQCPASLLFSDSRPLKKQSRCGALPATLRRSSSFKNHFRHSTPCCQAAFW